ncbi:hypothetical protein R1sor_020830 [Riccia sorocarpa]|uniref:Reverse transcriptase domain-containing protein n=1 Tax=Riccia sorocarpa TaxID=122646 RepID=A0ABD3GJI6_9MARC
MKSNKAPGHDGPTAEVVKMCWELVGDDCVRMVQAVWVKRRVLRSDMQCVIKISDNILSIKLGQEWAKWSDHEAILVKLDFTKAYDHVDHSFLWRTLEVMGFDRRFIEIVQGFMSNGTAWVHINKAFTDA